MGSIEGRDKILQRDPDFYKKIGAKGGSARKNDTPKRQAKRAIAHINKALRELEKIERSKHEASKN